MMKPRSIPHTLSLAGASLAALLMFPAPDSQAQTLMERKSQAVAVANRLQSRLSGELSRALQEGGPAAAVSVCSDIAPAIASELSQETGWKITRVGTRTRNALLGEPDEFELSIMVSFKQRFDRGEDWAEISYGAVFQEGERQYYRYIQPVPTQGVCLACHGSESDISPEVKSALDEHYPYDRALGYAVGELRGAISITQPMYETD